MELHNSPCSVACAQGCSHLGPEASEYLPKLTKVGSGCVQAQAEYEPACVQRRLPKWQYNSGSFRRNILVRVLVLIDGVETY